MRSGVAGLRQHACHPRLIRERGGALRPAGSASAMAQRRGCLFVFEGLDRAGKSTQAALLAKHLRNSHRAQADEIKFPDRSSHSGRIIHQYLAEDLDMDDHAMHLLFSANRWEKRAEMEAKLLSGAHLIVDRYAFSGVAYSAAKGKARLSRDWCRGVDRGLIAPDAVIFLKVDLEKAQSREDYGKERYEKAAFQKAVAQEFEALQDDTFHIIDADRSIEEVQAEVQAAADAVISRQRDEGLSPAELWAGER